MTNAVSHAQRLAAKGIKVFLIGGELKSSTEAVIGAQAMKNLQEYHLRKASLEQMESQKQKDSQHQMRMKPW